MKVLHIITTGGTGCELAVRTLAPWRLCPRRRRTPVIAGTDVPYGPKGLPYRSESLRDVAMEWLLIFLLPRPSIEAQQAAMVSRGRVGFNVCGSTC
jgi:hypothetical protein